ncbi:hypothetical protein SAMN04487819_112132 [Actinopolyspora alba]|uniref:Uncharacterized protein n=1 Tax=Actinopolyspora alba TaxID=673379 RepID=A0A1I2A4T4_9ACTN|nr:hypothetical protein SAMN04487819_112132 [Actinopolyspora alba]
MGSPPPPHPAASGTDSDLDDVSLRICRSTSARTVVLTVSNVSLLGFESDCARHSRMCRGTHSSLRRTVLAERRADRAAPHDDPSHGTAEHSGPPLGAAEDTASGSEGPRAVPPRRNHLSDSVVTRETSPRNTTERIRTEPAGSRRTIPSEPDRSSVSATRKIKKHSVIEMTPCVEIEARTKPRTSTESEARDQRRSVSRISSHRESNNTRKHDPARPSRAAGNITRGATVPIKCPVTC